MTVDLTAPGNRLVMQKCQLLLSEHNERTFTVAEVSDRVHAADDVVRAALNELVRRDLVRGFGEGGQPRYSSLSYVAPLAQASEERPNAGAVLDVLIANPERAYGIEELSKITGVTLHNVRQTLVYHTNKSKKAVRIGRGAYQVAPKLRVLRTPRSKGQQSAGPRGEEESTVTVRNYSDLPIMLREINSNVTRDFGIMDLTPFLPMGTDPRGCATKLSHAVNKGLIQRTTRGRYAALAFVPGKRAVAEQAEQAQQPPAAALTLRAPAKRAPAPPTPGRFADALDKVKAQRLQLLDELRAVDQAIETLERLQ